MFNMKKEIGMTLGLAALLMGDLAHSTSLYVMSVGESQVQVVIDGSSVRSLTVGETSPEGVTLKSIRNGRAVLEIDGKARSFSIGESTASQVVLTAGNDGHFRLTASINGLPVSALVDTGATNVIIGSATAVRLGIDYRRGRRETAQTANGLVTSYLITLPRIQVGDIALSNIACNVLEGAEISRDLQMLLGNSFLSQVHMQRSGNTMTLTRSNAL
jgi:aspartyl protease family protein